MLGGLWRIGALVLLLIGLSLGTSACLPPPPVWESFPCRNDESCGEVLDCVDGFCRSRCGPNAKCDKSYKCVDGNCIIPKKDAGG